jgi:hypothetical protein
MRDAQALPCDPAGLSCCALDRMLISFHAFNIQTNVLEDHRMTTYVCDKCGMSIGTMTCGKCGKELEHSTLTTAEGTTVHVSECPDGHGKVKSPMCCGQDMTCSL